MTDNRTDTLNAIAVALENGTITRNDLQQILGSHTAAKTAAMPSQGRTSAVDVMFYIAGIVLFAATAALIGQAWDGGSAVRIIFSAGLGLVFWVAALYLILAPNQGDIRRGMTNALLLSGSLSIISGGFIIANEYFDFDDFHFYATSLTLALLGALHISFGLQIRRNLLTLIGILLTVTAFPALVYGLLSGTGMPLFVNCLVMAVSGGLLAYVTRIVARISPSLSSIERFFDPLSAFTVLMSLYVASYDKGSGLLWLFVLIAGIVGLFYLSIVMQDKVMLGNGSLFLVLAIITISFRYFSDYGVPISLLIAALGLLGTAVMAATINRRYIKA